MNSLIPIDASRARSNFFKILERVYLNNESFLIKKGGLPMAEIVKPKKEKKGDLLKFAGVWKGTELDDDNLWMSVFKRKSRKSAINL